MDYLPWILGIIAFVFVIVAAWASQHPEAL